MKQTVMPRALTIAGSDSGGGAGIQADLKTFTVLGVYGASVITAVTAQNTVGVAGVEVLPPAFVARQLEIVAEDIGFDAVKTGMLATEGIVTAVAEGIRHFKLGNLVVDPVMISKSGHALLQPEAVAALRTQLLPLATVVTPNLPEAAAILDGRDASPREMARAIADMGPAHVVIKGGHAAGDTVTDLLYCRATGEFREFSGPRIATANTHGTGCTFASALAAGLAWGLAVTDAVELAQRFVAAAIATAQPLGHGHGPTNHIAAGRLLRERGQLPGGKPPGGEPLF